MHGGEGDQTRPVRDPVERLISVSPFGAKLDRGYDDVLEGRISQGFWSRKSTEWESELATTDAERSRLSRPTPAYAATGEKILELAKTAPTRYLEQDFEERRRLPDSLLSNCTFDRGTLCPTYAKPFDLLAVGNETGNWRRGWDSNPRAGYPTRRFRGAPVTTTSVPLLVVSAGCARDRRGANISLYRASTLSEKLLDKKTARLLQYTSRDREAMIEARQVKPSHR